MDELEAGAPDEPDWSELLGGGKALARMRRVASETWGRVVPELEVAGMLASVDRDALVDYALAEAELDRVRRRIARDGPVVTGDRGTVKHPGATVANQLRTHLRQLRGELGLSPKARVAFGRVAGGATGSSSPPAGEVDDLEDDEADDDGVVVEGRWDVGLASPGVTRTAAEVLQVEVPAPLYRVPNPSPDPDSPYYVEGVWFDQGAVDRVAAVAADLRHQKGRWRGTPVVLESWQIAHVVAPAFGWKYPDGSRVRRVVYLEVPRKNGKTTLCSVLGLVLLAADGEPAPEVYAGATTYLQASRTWKPAVDMAMGEGSPIRRAVRHVRGGQGKEHLETPGNAGEFWPVSRNADALHGANVHGWIVDELHLHPNAELVDALDTGTLARRQPLGVIITTADEGEVGTPYDERRREVEGMATGTIPWAPSVYGAVFAAPDDADPFAPESWAMANPNLGVTVLEEDIAEQAGKAQRLPSYFSTFCRLHLGQRRRSSVRWLPVDYWMACPRLDAEARDELADTDAWGGIDMAAVDDLVAFVLVFPHAVHVPPMGAGTGEGWRWEEDGVSVLAQFWMPSAALEKRRRMVGTFTSWAADGWLTITDGDAVDYAQVETDVEDLLDRWRVRAVGFDPWQARSTMQRLGDRVETVEVPQTFRNMAPGAHWLEGAVLRRAVRWDSPVLSWMVSNAVAKRDPDGRVKPDKRDSGEKVDGVTAMVTALSTWLDPDGTSGGLDQLVT